MASSGGEQVGLAHVQDIVERQLQRVVAGARQVHAFDARDLEALSDEFDISRERVRQIEVRAFEKVQKAVRENAEAAERALRAPERERISA